MRAIRACILSLSVAASALCDAATLTEENQTQTPHATPKGIPIEPRADLFTNSPNAIAMLDLLVSDVRRFGYKCDTVSGLASSETANSDGFRLSCNGRRYNYDIRDLGGHIAVKVLR